MTGPLAIAARILEAVKPVLVEKPLAPATSDAEPLDVLPAAASGSLMMGFNRRFWNPIRRLREMLLEDAPVEGASARLILKTDVSGWDAIASADDPLDDEELIDFARHVREGTPPRPGLADGLAVLRAAAAARRSAARGGAEVPVQ